MTALFAQPAAAAWSKKRIAGHAGIVADSVYGTIRTAAEAHPRSQQVALGMSEIGEPCARKLGYQLLEHPKTNTQGDPWAATVGTAIHTWLAETFLANNEVLPDGRLRYVVEQRVTAGHIFGSADLLDRKLHTLIDWKNPGTTGMKRYRDGHISTTYRVQAHGYGVGYVNASERVDHVAIVFLPRAGNLSDLHVWSEPLNTQLVEENLQRVSSIADLIVSLDCETHPERYGLLPPTPSQLCGWCPWHLPRSTDLGVGCPGNT